MDAKAKVFEQAEQPQAAMCLRGGGTRRQRILVPVDCSEFADAVLETAACTARMMNAEVHLIAVLSPEHDRATVRPLPTWYPSYDENKWGFARSRDSAVVEWRDQALAATRSAAEDYLHQAAEHFSGLPVTTLILVRPSVGEAIIDYARDCEIDLIAMATHGRKRLAQALLGSVASEVVHSGVAPCLLVKPKAD
jgi:nucleotide-binding universal stress UspA family protein